MSSNADLHARRQAAIPRGVCQPRLAVYAERASSAELWDVEGKRYIDFASGISVLNTGARASEGEGGGRGAAREASCTPAFR